MAYLESFSSFDLNDVNLYWYSKNWDGSDLADNAYVELNGQVYEDLFYVDGYDGFNWLELVFLGSGISQDLTGAVTAGTVNFVGEIDLLTDALLWYAEGISISAVAIYNAALTPSNLDEIAIIQTALAGNDTIVLSPDDDRMYGFSGDDDIYGNGGNDTLDAGSGDDWLTGGAGNDTLNGGTGNDQAWYDDAVAGVIVNLATGTARSIDGDAAGIGIDNLISIEHVTGGGAADSLTGNAGGNFLDGDGGDDWIFGADGADTLLGWDGNDQLLGGNGNDTLEGENGNDTLTGGSGVDTLTGGTGNDTFQDTKAGISGDTITDFSVGDSIVIADASLAGFTFALNGTTLTYTGGSLELSGPASGTIIASTAAGGGVQLMLQTTPTNSDAAHDFNGDGRSDLMWRNDAGQLSEFLAQPGGGFAWNANAAYTVGIDWSIKAFGDFNGDNRDDILWRQDSSGTMMVWNAQANGSFAWAVNYALPTDLAFNVVGDFNGDGRDDIMWRDANGALSEWLGHQNGSFAWNPNASYQLDSSWQIVAAGDFNADGKDDLLWRQTGTGTVMEWLGQTGGTFAWSANFSIGTDFHLEGIGDFNGDNRDDLMWRSGTGALSEWTAGLDGSFAWNPNLAATVSNTLQVASIGDFNGDNIDEIEWRDDTNGAITGWLGQSDGTFVANPLGDFALGTTWHSQPPFDQFL